MSEKGAGWKALERAKAKRQPKPQTKELSEAECFFSKYCYPEAPFWENRIFKQAALNVLGSGIFGENELKGHAGHKKTYPVPLGDLIIHLVETHFKYVDIIFAPGDILKAFDGRFEMMAAMARIGGVRDETLKRIQTEWREKISLAGAQGKFPSNWREIAKMEMISSWKYRPRSEAHASAHVFLGYLPQAPPSRIVEWVNLALTSLKRPTLSKSGLHNYISKEQQKISEITPISTTK